MTVAAVITARKGSRRIPDKNLAEINGRPLISYTCGFCLRCVDFDEIILTTDDERVADLFRTEFDKNNDGRLKIVERPAVLAGDKATSVDAVIHAYAASKSTASKIALLQPTSPFRKLKHIKDCIGLLDGSTDTVISISPFRKPPEWALWFDEITGKVGPVFPSHNLQRGIVRGQDQQKLYHPNGCFYVTRASSFLNIRSFYLGDVKGCVSDIGVDIDDKEGLMYAEFLISHNLIEFD